ncbi:endonuclease-reverse transcriptase [Plakobranchus ocellatus]|uniref:Endonuclease-reverse transcriptase n=1 Tax=Plakobranchus ocellatus TaxID=259542 RepID=A0AAV4E126_9GAST|nr:endonuclease-reverse transcriptase [Plakobranchus ocellatus]
MERILDENQPRVQAGFRKGYSTTDHIYTLNQVIEKSNEYNVPLCVGFIDYDSAFDSVEHFAIFDALRKININETYVTILENIYRNASARVHIDNLESEPFPIHRGVRQGNPISPKLFTAAIEMIFRKADLEHGLNVDGETLKNLKFADDIALVTEKVENMEEQLNVLNNISLESGLKMHKGKTKYMNNFESNKDITIEKEKVEKVESYKYLGQTTYLKDTRKEEVTCRIRAGWSCFGRNREIFLDDKLPISLKIQVYDQCVLPTMTYGCQTWSLTKASTQKLRVAQRAMERKILGIKLADRVKCSEIVHFVAKQKWKWAGHVARLKDSRWTLRVTEWQPRNGKRSRGRQARRWRDDIVKTKGNTWSRDARDRDECRRDAEGYILQWLDRAS